MLHKDEMTTYMKARMIDLFPKQVPILSSFATLCVIAQCPTEAFLEKTVLPPHFGSSDPFHPSPRYNQEPTLSENIPYVIVSYGRTSASNKTPLKLPTALVLAKPAHILQY